MLFPASVPLDLTDTSIPLKKILLWNGASSWGNIRPGRGEFLKQQCPVSSCVISTNRAEAEEADLILFKDHFASPTHVRLASQIWMLFLLGGFFCPVTELSQLQLGNCDWATRQLLLFKTGVGG